MTNLPIPVSVLRSNTAGVIATSAQLAPGQLFVNAVDEVLFMKTDAGLVKQIGVKATALKPVAFTGSYNDLTDKPNISGEYVLPPASGASLGGVIVGAGLTVNGGGTLAANVLSVNGKTGAAVLAKADVGFPSDFLDGSNKVAVQYLPDSVTAGLQYKGTYNGSTHLPALPDAAAGNTSWLYVVNVAGTATFPTNSSITVAVGDWLISNGSAWQLVPLVSGNVTSVNSLTGNVTINAANLPGLAQVAKDNQYSSLSNIPSTFTPAAHTHTAAQVTGLATVATTGNYSDLNGLPPDPTIAQVGVSVSGDPAILGQVDYVFTRSATFPAQFAGSQCKVALSGGTTATINILKNGSIVGTITTNTATGTFSTTVSAPTLFAPGDILSYQFATTNIVTFASNILGNWTS